MNIDTELIRPLAAKLNLSFTAFGEVITDPSAPPSGSVALSNPRGTQLEPAPTSPYKDSVAFDILSGTIKSVYNIHRGLGGNDNIKVYPNYMSGNTGRTTSFQVVSELTLLNRYKTLLEAVGEHLQIQPLELL